MKGYNPEAEINPSLSKLLLVNALSQQQKAKQGFSEREGEERDGWCGMKAGLLLWVLREMIQWS